MQWCFWFLTLGIKKIVPLDLRNQALNLMLGQNTKQFLNDLGEIPQNPRWIGKFQAVGN